MRALTAILAIFGSVWAILGLFGATMMISYPPATTSDALYYLITVGLFTAGFFVWWGWVFYSVKGRYPIVAHRTFWIVTLSQHIVTFVYLIAMDLWSRPEAPLVFLIWVAANALIAAIVLAYHPLSRIQESEQDIPPSA